MKSVVITLIIGTIMIGGSIFYTSHLTNKSHELVEITNEIESSINNDDFKSATDKINKLDKSVSKFEKFFLATGDHIEMDNIRANIAELRSFTNHEIKADALSKVYVLQFLFKHLPHNNRLRIGNIL